MLSPFRYPGGKSRLATPVVALATRALQEQCGGSLLEPFAGGASVGLAAASQGLPVHLVEADERVSTFWEVALGEGRPELCRRILTCDPLAVWETDVRQGLAKDKEGRALAALVQNRLAFGGNMTARPGAIKVGDRGRGRLSRWYPETSVKRIEALAGLPISSQQGCALDFLRQHQGPGFAFIDPPYEEAGRRLYAHNRLNLVHLLETLGALTFPWLLTYEATAKAETQLQHHQIAFVRVGLLGNSGQVRTELVAGPWDVICQFVEELRKLKRSKHVVA